MAIQETVIRLEGNMTPIATLDGVSLTPPVGATLDIWNCKYVVTEPPEVTIYQSEMPPQDRILTVLWVNKL